MTVDCIIEDTRWEGIALLATRASDAALAHLGYDPAEFEISLLACDDARIAALNADFRGKPAATNVLSWPSDERGADVDGDPPVAPELPMDAELGDIAIAFDTCTREAQEAGKSMVDHTLHLLVHGTLHLLGYDHERDKDATVMERLEVAILGKLGVSDPYKEN
ncbi:probable rRNA maturation factor [Yoonia tamlensis]|uniref:Endoribonuclease YbeY n=1 Tax=Yoonia tamlensis TaxID=390270 RepID=A0A1I6GQ20_9RHOB|nr:rRNA maturation RNase YbeY [Yoonia tamlensis]SFR44313.1 probable rRNA maturation factor [Yoonia tamlensis]